LTDPSGSWPGRQRFEVSEQVAWRAATLMRDYRRSHTGIGPGDYLIAATALTEGLELGLGRHSRGSSR